MSSLSCLFSFVGFISNLTVQRQFFPTDEDQTGAAKALLRLQDTYQLSANTISNGDLPGERLCMSMCLCIPDCLQIFIKNQAHCITMDNVNSLRSTMLSVIRCYYISSEILWNVPMGSSNNVCAILKKWKHHRLVVYTWRWCVLQILLWLQMII